MPKPVHSNLPAPMFETLEDRRLLSTVNWGTIPKLVQQDQAVANYPAITGAGTSIAILDSGINYNDPALGSGFGPGHKVIAGYDFVDNDTNPMDSDGHGTGLASVAGASTYSYNGANYQGVAPGANLIALRVDDGTYGWAKEAPLAKLALQWVIDHRDEYNIVAVNMSFGKGHYTDPTTLAVVANELQQLNAMGVLLVAAAGNDGVESPPTIEYPAADPNVYAVGSINGSDVISSFSSRNQYLDILAPGEDQPLIYYLPQTGQRAILGGSGTSFSTPYIAAMAALMKQIDPTLTTAEMISILQRSGSANYDGDKEAAPYTGLTFQRLNINAALAMTYAERDDVHENNDTTGTATTLSFSDNIAALDNLKLLVADADFYKFTLGTQADVDYSISATDAAAPASDLLDANGTLLMHLPAAGQIRLGAGTYYVRFNAVAATLTGTYGLSIAQTPDDALNNHTTATATPISLDVNGHGALTGMFLLGGSDDYYAFTLDVNSDVDLAIPFGGTTPPSAQLLDINGNLISNIGAGASARLNAGRYLIRVYSANTLDDSYDVTVDAAAVVVVMPGLNGSSNGIAYDAAGTLHLAYYDEATKNLKYATRNSSGLWSNPVVVDGGLMAGQFVSLMLDANGRAGIAYYDANQADLKYAHFNGTTWDVMTVDSTFTTGYYPSLQFDNSNSPVISYYYKTGADLKLASLANGTWNLSTIDSAGDVGRYSSMALNRLTGRWSMAYEDTGHGHFKYADQTKNGWSITTVDDTTQIGGGYISLAFSPRTKRPEFSYYDAYNANLKLAVFNGSVWSNQLIAGKGTVGLYTNLFIDANGNEDILYYNKGADSAFRAKFNAGVWDLNQVTSDGGRWISRAIDSAGRQTMEYLQAAGIAAVEL